MWFHTEKSKVLGFADPPVKKKKWIWLSKDESILSELIGRQILNSHLSEGTRDERRRIETRELRYSKVKLSLLKEILACLFLVLGGKLPTSLRDQHNTNIWEEPHFHIVSQGKTSSV